MIRYFKFLARLTHLIYSNFHNLQSLSQVENKNFIHLHIFQPISTIFLSISQPYFNLFLPHFNLISTYFNLISTYFNLFLPISILFLPISTYFNLISTLFLPYLNQPPFPPHSLKQRNNKNCHYLDDHTSESRDSHRHHNICPLAGG
jgi:hypothetical protein